MLRAIIHNRMPISFALSCISGYVLLHRWPFPADDAMLQVVLLHKPWLFESIRWSYTAMLFSTPLIGFSSLLALLYIFAIKDDATLVSNPLPPYPSPTVRQQLYLILGEIHQQKRLGPVENPQWLTIPERGLFTGIAVFGAIGSGKTSCCMAPFAEQILFLLRRRRGTAHQCVGSGSEGGFLFQDPEVARGMWPRRGLRRDQSSLPVPLQSPAQRPRCLCACLRNRILIKQPVRAR
jgi:hypothetical protein